MTVFWDIAPGSLGVDRCFRGAYCPHHQGSPRRLWSLYLLLWELDISRSCSNLKLSGATIIFLETQVSVNEKNIYRSNIFCGISHLYEWL